MPPRNPASPASAAMAGASAVTHAPAPETRRIRKHGFRAAPDAR